VACELDPTVVSTYPPTGWLSASRKCSPNSWTLLACPNLLEAQAVITGQAEHWEGLRSVIETTIAVGKGAVREWNERVGISPRNDQRKAARSFQRSCD